MSRAATPREWLYPEIVETEYDNHGCLSGNIPEADLELVKRCDVLLAYVNARDNYGTFCEIAVASALNRTIYTAVWDENYPEDEDE